MKKSTRSSLVLIMVAISLASTAYALEDGGGRSVFARGAGERALALGGASVALSGDPSIMVWNPAGLAGLDRTGFSAAGSDLIGMGFSERMGAVVLPHWRVGTFGLAFRRFAVDGIEERDDRGTLGNPDLSDAETEIALGFGRDLGRAWRLGAAAKYQQQSLAGYTDGALGLDFGMSVRPMIALGLDSPLAEGLSLGLTVRNLVEPSLRLADESVPDPTGLRLGTAMSTPLGSNLDLVLTADLDKTRDMEQRIHAGAELTLLHMLALRCGSNDGMMTAGAGLKYDGLAFDYAFEDNIIAGVHRFGLGLAFGPTTAAKRQKFQQAQDAAIRDRLATMFESQQVERNAGLLSQVKQDLDQGDDLAAMNGIASLRVLDPEQPDLDRLEAQAYLLQAREKRDSGDFTAAVVAYQRCLALDPGMDQARTELQTARDRNDRLTARSQELRALLDQALAHYAAGELIPARDGFQAIVDITPDDNDAGAFLAATLQSIELQCETLADKALVAAQLGDFSTAFATLDQARILGPENKHLAEQERRVQELRKTAERDARVEAGAAARKPSSGSLSANTSSDPGPTTRPTYADLPFKRQAEIGRLYREGVLALKEQRREDAIRYWELVWGSAPDYQQVEENLLQEYLVQGMEAFAAGRLDQSITIWEKALKVSPDDPRTKGYLARAYDHRARIMRLKEEGK